MAWSTPLTFVAATKHTAAALNAGIRDCLKAIGDPWTDYTPTVTNASADATGRYIEAGKLIHVHFRITFTGAATGTVIMSLPVDSLVSSNNTSCGSIVMVDTSVGSGSRRSGTAMFNSGTGVFFQVDSLSTNAAVAAAVPWTWASGDTIGGTITYEAA